MADSFSPVDVLKGTKRAEFDGLRLEVLYSVVVEEKGGLKAAESLNPVEHRSGTNNAEPSSNAEEQ